MLSYLRSESSDQQGVRVVTANNLCVYWSGDDPFAAERTPPIHLPNLLTKEMIEECHQAARACGQFMASTEGAVTARVSEALKNEWYDVVYSPQHVACYLHRNGHFATNHPQLLSRLVSAMIATYQGVPPPRVPLFVRCVELHAYSVGGALLDAGHKDNGSKRTLIVQLSDAKSFSGVRFVTWEAGEHVLHELQAGDGLLINSEKMHNVAPVTRGVRHSLVIELWVAPENKCDRFG